MSAHPSLHQPQDPTTVNKLLATLNEADRKNPKTTDFTCRKTTFTLAGTDHTIDSWKLPEFAFKKRDLPTYARGLFTWKDPVSGNHRIAVRGYDKFFNIDEIPRTKWDWIQENTKPPYELTMKENGCIIFVSGLSDGTLLVCSKHSIGSRGIEASHAVVGERWIEKQLAEIGKTKQDLALALYGANATAVAELCDDSFEEHILAYEGDDAGLYLHGVNLNLKDFATYSAEDVRKFAEEWAFRKINCLNKDSVADLRELLEEAAETGSWEGKDVEGFVIRCKARNGPNDTEWHDWFFKYKFEEPYLMYRQWREVTKAMLAGKEPRYRKQQAITKEYLRFAKAYFVQNEGAAELYKANHGIIKLRDAFLAHRGLRGSDIIKQSAEEEANNASANFILVPIATIGCGKTTVAHALTKLFGWGHLQNDNITAKKQKSQAFATACAECLAVKTVVIADRNNHQKRERQQLFDDLNKSDTRFIALHYVHYKGINDNREFHNQIRKTTRERVFSRGDDHQTIQAASKNKYEIEGIMEGFMHRFQPVDTDSTPDSNFDLVIDLDPLKDSRENLETVVKELHKHYPQLVPEVPSAELLDEAIRASFDEYKPAVKLTIRGKPPQNMSAKPPNLNNSQQQKQPKKLEIEYFSITVPAKPVNDIIEKAFMSAPPEKRTFFDQLKESRRIQQDFHVTLIHRANSKKFPEMWEKYNTLHQAEKGRGVMGRAILKLEKLVWDGRIMAIVVDIAEKEWECSNDVAHITVGTASLAIKPKEANDMLVQKWQLGQGTEEIPLGEELSGTVEAIRPSGRF